MLYEPLKMFEFLLATIIRNFSYAVIRYKINDEKSNNLLSVSCRYNSTCTEYIDKQTLIVWIVRHSFHKYFLRVFPRIGFDCGEFCGCVHVCQSICPFIWLWMYEYLLFWHTLCVFVALFYSLAHSLTFSSLLFSPMRLCNIDNRYTIHFAMPHVMYSWSRCPCLSHFIHFVFIPLHFSFQAKILVWQQLVLANEFLREREITLISKCLP